MIRYVNNDWSWLVIIDDKVISFYRISIKDFCGRVIYLFYQLLCFFCVRIRFKFWYNSGVDLKKIMCYLLIGDFRMLLDNVIVIDLSYQRIVYLFKLK